MDIGSKMALLPLLLLLQLARALLPMAEANQGLCEDVRIQCAFDSSCADAMKNYFIMCDNLMNSDDIKTCPESCLYALVALTTTRYGQRLLDCTCRDSYCDMMKSRVEVCRPLVVYANKNETVVPCEMGRWVCLVNAQCSLALSYHVHYCETLEQDEACSERCFNSWDILRRQEKAFMLNRCRCMGSTALDCLRHKENMVRYCFGGLPNVTIGNRTRGGNRTGGGNRTAGGGKVQKNRRKHRPKGFDQDPDRFEVELMLTDPMYQPDLVSRQKPFDYDRGSASALRPPPLAFVLLQCSVAVILLVKRG